MTPRKATTKPTDIIGVHLRTREDLRARLAEQAKLNKNTLNAELVSRLEGSLEKDTTKSLQQITAELAKVLRHAKRVA